MLRGSLKSAVIVAAGNQISVLSADSSVQWSSELSSSIQSVCPHPTKPQFVWINSDGAVILQNNDGTDPITTVPNTFRSNLKSRDCHFDETGAFLWLSSCAKGICEIQLIETLNWTSIHKITIEDPFGDSYCILTDTGLPALISLWLTAGQDGQKLFWLKRNREELTCAIEDSLANCTPPIFLPDGSKIIIVNDVGTLSTFNYPNIH